MELKKVLNGLQARRGDNIIAYTYGHGSNLRPVEWKPLVRAEKTIYSEHIRCVLLKEGEDFDQLVEHFQRVHAKAVVFVNTRDDFEVEAQRWPQRSTIPVLLLKASDGKELLSILETNNEVYGKVDNKSTKENEISLDAEIRKLMFNNDTPIIVSEDAATFQFIMSTFQHYEKTSKSDGSYGDILKLLLKQLNDVFERDFPFYILHAYRIRRNDPCKPKSESKEFVCKIMDKMEALDTKKLCSTLTAFLQRGDFPVMFEQHKSYSSVFKLLEDACLKLSLMSLKNHKIECEERSPELVYKRMIWISVALKCHTVTGTETESVPDIWKRYLLQMRGELVFNPETIYYLGCGLRLTKQLEIPSTYFMKSDQMAELALADEDCVRPFSHLTNYLNCIAEFITNANDSIDVIITLRAKYQFWILEKATSLTWSIERTVAGAIEEGILFVEILSCILKRKQVEEELAVSETWNWLILLLELVDMTKSNAEKHIMKFLENCSKNTVLEAHCSRLANTVIERTRQSFPHLLIHQFFLLYKNLKIWPDKFVQEYLSVYVIPSGMRICDGTWNVFVSEVISRYPGAHNHRFLLEFINRVGKNYAIKQTPLAFILDLLYMKVPMLFALPEKADKDYCVAVKVQSDFSTFLQRYIHSHSLMTGLLQKMSQILGIISKHHDEFQQLILTVLQKEIIPELRTLQNGQHFTQEVLKSASTELQKDLTCVQALNPQQKFCWGILGIFCSKTSASITADSFDWLYSCNYIIIELGKTFASYCNGMGLDTKEWILSDTLPHDVARLHSDDVVGFFRWIRKLQMVLLQWQKKIIENDCNYDYILSYASNQSILSDIAPSVCPSSVTFDLIEIKNYYLELFENVNCHLIKYIPGHPDAMYCTLPQILNQYGVIFPPIFTKHLLFPEEKVPPTGEQLMEHPLNPSTKGMFQLQHPSFYLRATKGLTMKELVVLAKELDQYVKPISECMEILVFFHLYQSEIFNNYLYYQLRKEQSVKQFPSSAESSMGPSISLWIFPKEERPQGTSLQILAKALNATKTFLFKVIQGTAKYSEIIPEGGKLTLESINIETEFNTLVAFATVTQAPHNSHERLQGICSMLELFKYTSVYIPAIHGVCKQYNLEGCLNDTNLRSAVTLAAEAERSKADLTTSEAIEKLQHIKHCLLHNNARADSSFGLFSAVANSAAFYQFVRDKKFHDERGQALFVQQYQLITAQLQHEEYNENVLNHLYVAYKFILPFMDTKQSFMSLMIKITSLDVCGGLKQLETVNSNINLILLWFSKAEGDTLQNVAKDLDCIIKTGHYTFEFSSNEAIYITLHYCPAVSAHATMATEPSSSEESPQQKLLVTENDDKKCKEKLSEEQIEEFVRKLGFFDAEEEEGYKIKHFLRINETANTILKLYSQLRDLGCADFTIGAKPIMLPCATEDTDSLVNAIKTRLSVWKDELSKLREENAWMSFFCTPKLLLLHKNLCDWMSLSGLCDSKSSQDMKEKMDAMRHMIEIEELKHELCISHIHNEQLAICTKLLNQTERDIVREISFLSTSDYDNMKKKVQATLKQCQHDQTPMVAISTFLSTLLQDHLLPTQMKPERKSFHINANQVSTSTQSSQVLHSCPGFTQKELIPLILSIFDGLPESFQVFRCQSSSTEEELDLFLHRCTKFAIPHLILEVNKLPFVIHEHLMKFHLEIKEGQSLQTHNHSCLHFIETNPSNVRDVPHVIHKEHKIEPLSSEKVQYNKLARAFVTLVYGNAGDGKTHYIKRQLSRCPLSCTITVNEAFTPLGAIKKLRCLPFDKPNCAVFFNFTLLPPPQRDFLLQNVNGNPDNEDRQTAEYTLYHRLIDVIGWFFFDLLILGYVEDKDTGLSFCLPGGLNWVIYVEVPSRGPTMTPDLMLEQFCCDIPILGLLGSVCFIPNNTSFVINEEVQLVCKYLKAYKDKKIDRLYKDGGSLVKFSMDRNITEEDCQKLLCEFMPDHIKNRKITQHLFIKYMNTRCQFLDCLPAFNYNTGVGEYMTNAHAKLRPTNTKTLGSTLMEAMLKEVCDFCDPTIKENWSLNLHQQLIYDMSTIDLITLHADQLTAANHLKFIQIGVNIPSMMEMHSREVLDKYLSKALGVELKDGRLKQIDDANYVLTLDYALKMLNIHERCRCGVPVIIEGETGVGKTALVQMLSVLWNHSLLGSWKREKGRIHDALTQMIDKISENVEDYGKYVQLIKQLSEDKYVSYEDLQLLCNLPGTRLRQYLLGKKDLPVVKLLVTKEKKELSALFMEANESNALEATAKLLQAIYFAELKTTFHKLNIHAALTPHEIQTLLKPALDQARELQLQLGPIDESERVPVVTVFLDEINTCSCLGLLKEFIVDKTLDGEPIPDNMIIVAACNPHRGNSLASHEQEKWLRGSYYVRPLHPTLQLIMWDYGSLDSSQERDYINAKMKILHPYMGNVKRGCLTELILESQEEIRKYATQQLRSNGLTDNEAKIASHSCVSQRDIQRVFILYEWLMKGYEMNNPHKDCTDYNLRAVLVALGIVYYMRLNTKFRKEYKDIMDKRGYGVSFSKAFNDELEWYIGHMELPQGIAKTQALKENIFATIICTVTRIPLIIVGAPGSSKTLSFNITVANLKGQESKTSFFRHMMMYPSLDPYYYQCSRRTTSNEIQTVFSQAINRQKSHTKASLSVNCVVFMDEAGLPEESHESLKVLHSYLDNPQVSFVAITNHVLDAAKTNRAISLFRPESPADDLETLVRGCLCWDPDCPPLELKNDTIAQFCRPYLSLIKQKEFKQFFGLRDFIHFVNYFRRKCQNKITAQLVLEALERNFNGSDDFKSICKEFLSTLGSDFYHQDVTWRHILDILHDSLADRPNHINCRENGARYKLIIDPSEDDSVVRLLFTFGILHRKKTRLFVCSDFPGDTHVQKINTIAAIRHSAIEGHTVILAQTDDIHESFYDLFNQRFRRIDDTDGPRYYANIAIGAHSKPCRVHPEFQCVVVVKQSEVKNMPAPFLNRFEKYCLTHYSLLEAAISLLPPCMAIVINTVREKVNNFVESVQGKESLYGLKKETVDSLIITLLPTERYSYQPYVPKCDPLSYTTVAVVCLQELICALRSSAGFHIPACSLDELTDDAQHVSHLLCADSQFKELLKDITPQVVVQAVNEAMDKLHKAPSPHDNIHTMTLSPEGCMMVAMTIQWLVRHLCKRLMQLMTPEALTIHRMKMDYSYLVNYLKYQSHFSLKELINDRLHALNHATAFCPTKLLCYTRTSSLIHKLPLSSSGAGILVGGLTLAHNAIKDHVHDDVGTVMVHKLSNKSQSTIMELLKMFAGSKNAQVLLLIASMAEVTVPMVNHLRIMIEEAENQYATSQKLFVLLLHFPPHNFLNHCYPTLYLRGWDHYYLDTIGHDVDSGVIDVNDWFIHCCFPPDSDVNVEENSLTRTTEHLLQEIIPIISYRVPFSSHEGFPFNGQFTISERNRLLYELLITKKVGRVLCSLFRSYWKPNVMCWYLEQAASLTHQQQSTLNITDALHAAFKNSFMDFMVAMVFRMNENCNIDSIFANGGSLAVDTLFRDLLAVSPLPQLAQLKLLSNNLQSPSNPGYIPLFPFFHLIVNQMEHLTEQCRRDTNEGADIFGNDITTPCGQPQDMNTEFTRLCERLLHTIKKNTSNDCVIICINAMAHNPELWTSYFCHFIFSKLHLTGSESTNEKQIILEENIIQKVFGNLNDSDVIKRVVNLHVCVSVYHLELAQLATNLRPLAQIQKIRTVPPNILSPPPPSPKKQFECVIQQSGHTHTMQQLSVFVVSFLFNALLGCTYGGLSQESTLEQLKQWYKAYMDITTLPSLVNKINSDLAMLDGPTDAELAQAQFNVMQTTFFVIQCWSDCNNEVLTMGQMVFCTLFTKHFKENGELNGRCPQLGETYKIAVEVMAFSHFKDKKIHRLTERIFNHFFPRCTTTNFSTDNCRWFLACANSQIQWLKSEEGTGNGKVNLEMAHDARDKISINIFKLYLSRILGECSSDDTDADDPLRFYNRKLRSLVGEVLMSTPDLGPPTHYIPLFYQQSMFVILEQDIINKRMQQPLAHLYFLLLMEHLAVEQQALEANVHKYLKISELCKSADKTNEEKVLLYIEQQAVTQIIAKQVAFCLDPEQKKMGQLFTVIEVVNSILDDSTTGGGACKGHALVLALHLFKHFKSFRKCIDLLTVKFQAVCQGVKCLKQFNDDLKSQMKIKPHLFPFMMEGSQNVLASTYQRVSTVMLKINNGKGIIDDFKKIATEYFTPTQVGVDMRGVFRMAVWLTVYYDFFDKKRTSKQLCNAIGGNQLSPFFEEGHIAIIQCFLNPSLMLTNQNEGKDPILELFRPSENHSPDQSDIDLRHALANMIAMVIASPKASNHLWYHMFAPDELLGTYMTGFMYDTTIGPSGLHYDCGVYLSQDGHIDCPSYLKHAARWTYTLHSLYLLLWANFGAFCVALLTQPNADKKLWGTIISDRLSIRHYCVSQLKETWQYMGKSFNISDEERSFFIMRCMIKFYELCTAGKMNARLSSKEQLDSYERLWHSQIYQPSWTELKEAFSQYLHDQKNPVLLSIRSLDEQYPQFTTEKDFLHYLLSYGDMSLHKQGEELYFLTQFILEYPRLEAGGHLLPDLVEFYLLLHIELAYVVSYDQATELKIGHVMERLVERYSKDFGKRVKELYERVKEGYNAYVETIGHDLGTKAFDVVCYGNKLHSIDDDTPLLHFLSDTPEEGEGNDWLYTVMADIINTHNNFIQGLYTSYPSVCHLLPSEASKIPIAEFKPSHCIVGKKSLHGIDDFLQLVRSRYTPWRTTCVPAATPPKVPRTPSSSKSSSLVEQQTTCQFDLHLLQQDVVTAYLAGKPLVESAISFRTHFKFRNMSQDSSAHPKDVASSGGDIETLGNQLPDSFKVACGDSTMKEMEFEFHSASYLAILEAVQVMKNVLGHLIKLIKEGGQVDPVKMQTIQQFVATLDSQIDQNSPVFAKISTPTLLSTSQLKFLKDLSTVTVFSCLQQFIEWLEKGMYGFHTLPFALKTHLSSEDQEALFQIPAKWKGDKKKLLDELKGLTDSLVHSEAYIVKNTNEIHKMPIKKLLEDLHFISQDDALPAFIPDTVCAQHYVAFRILLNSLIGTVQQCGADKGKGEVEVWQEFVEDIWDKHLPHFRDLPGNGGTFAYNPIAGKYGFAEGLSDNDQRPLADVLNHDAISQEVPQESDDAVVSAVKEGKVASPQEDITTALGELAKSYTIEDVLSFLQSNGMNQYIEAFKNEEIDGTLLVDLREAELCDLGVSSRFECFKIQFLFKRTLQQIKSPHGLAVVQDFLAKHKMDKYKEQFSKGGVDGDMLLEILQLLPAESGDTILEELGVSKLHIKKMRKLFNPLS